MQGLTPCLGPQTGKGLLHTQKGQELVRVKPVVNLELFSFLRKKKMKPGPFITICVTYVYGDCENVSQPTRPSCLTITGKTTCMRTEIQCQREKPLCVWPILLLSFNTEP